MQIEVESDMQRKAESDTESELSEVQAWCGARREREREREGTCHPVVIYSLHGVMCRLHGLSFGLSLLQCHNLQGLRLETSRSI